jgi:hypothetical protein
MLPNLPTLHSDQTLYSWCGLTHHLNGASSVLATSRMLFDAPYAALCHDFPSHLHALSRNTNGLLGPIESVALRNTLLGYYLAIIGHDQSTKILEALIARSVPHIKMLLGITASRIGGHHPLKGCAECIQEDEDRAGFAYWHVEHQLPSCFVCMRHRRPLLLVQDSVTPVHRRCWLLPRSCPVSAFCELRVPHEAPGDSLHRLAVNSYMLMRMPPGSLAPPIMANTYQRLLRDAGLASRNGNLRIGPLVALIRDRYAGLSGLPGLSSLNISERLPGLVASISRRSPRPGHPLKHLLLITAVCDSWENFLEACTRGTVKPDQALAPPTNRLDDRLQKFRARLVDDELTLTAASRALGVTTSTGAQWAAKLGIDYKRRTKSVFGPVIAGTKELLTQGARVPRISSAMGTSPSTVNRILATDAATQRKRRETLFTHRKLLARQSFSELCKANRAQPLSIIRSIPGNAYMWLYRHDREWLDRKLRSLGRKTHRNH